MLPQTALVIHERNYNTMIGKNGLLLFPGLKTGQTFLDPGLVALFGWLVIGRGMGHIFLFDIMTGIVVGVFVSLSPAELFCAFVMGVFERCWHRPGAILADILKGFINT